jgi:hypothetical protein
MAERTIQICPAHPDIRVAWYKDGDAIVYPPVCLAIVEKGTAQDVLYMELVDNEVVPVDTENKNFMGFVQESNYEELAAIKAAAEIRKEKEDVKPKQ